MEACIQPAGAVEWRAWTGIPPAVRQAYGGLWRGITEGGEASGFAGTRLPDRLPPGQALMILGFDK